MAKEEWETSQFEERFAELQAGLNRNAERLRALGINLDDIQSESEKQVQPPKAKFEADRLAFILGRPAADRSLEDLRYLNAFPDERRQFIMQNGTAEPVDQRFLAGTIIAEMKSIDEASRAETTDVEKERLAQDIGRWMKGDAIKPGEFDDSAIKPGMDDASSRGAAAAILRALGK
jgi:hypothetical protein